MKETELKILFPTERLDALRFFIGKKEMEIQQELKDYLDKTYEKVVPAHVREYVESRIEQDSVQEQAQTAEPEVQAQAQPSEPQPEQQRERQPRQSRRQREQQAAVEIAPSSQDQAESEAPAEEEAQGMTMSM